MGMTIGAAAAAVGVSAKAVRLWESRGLLLSAERTESGYRVLTEDDLAILRFIRQAKALGLTLTEIKDVLELQRNGAVPCDQVIQIVDTHIAQIDRTMRELRHLRRSLADARRIAKDGQSRGEEAVVCRVIETAVPAA
jgi:MerR family copper efflux transcriptional regulator